MKSPAQMGRRKGRISCVEDDLPVSNLEEWFRDTEMLKCLISQAEHLWVRARLGCRALSS